MTTSIRFAALVLLASCAGLALGADDHANPPRRLVRYADLDIGHKAGAEQLYHRIRAAAREVCEPQLSRVLITGPSYEHCVTDAIGRAVAEVNAPALETLYRETPR